MKIERQTAAVLMFFVPICIIFLVHSVWKRDLALDLVEDQQRELERNKEFQFKQALSLIKQLEKEQFVDATYTLFTIGKMNVPTSESEDLAEFEQMYRVFVEEQCGFNHIRSCVSYGNLLEERGEYDLAREAYLKGASDGEPWSIAALVDLYRNEDWKEQSEEKAKQWLLKLGK